MQNQSNREITFDTQLKTALSERLEQATILAFINVFFFFYVEFIVSPQSTKYIARVF